MKAEKFYERLTILQHKGEQLKQHLWAMLDDLKLEYHETRDAMNEVLDGIDALEQMIESEIN